MFKFENFKNYWEFRSNGFKAQEKPEDIEAEDNELFIYGPVYDFAIFPGEITPKDIVNKLKAMSDFEEIFVRLNSPGGDVLAGAAIYNNLVRFDGKVNITIDGLAASAASIIAMAGDTISMSDAGSLMIHDPWSIMIGNSDDFLQMADTLEKIATGMVNTYSARTGTDKKEIRQMMKDETWFIADEALEKGFVDEVIPAKEAPDAEAKFDLSIFGNVPQDVKERYGFEDPPKRSEAEIKLETPPSVLNKKRLIRTMKLQ